MNTPAFTSPSLGRSGAWLPEVPHTIQLGASPVALISHILSAIPPPPINYFSPHLLIIFTPPHRWIHSCLQGNPKRDAPYVQTLMQAPSPQSDAPPLYPISLYDVTFI